MKNLIRFDWALKRLLRNKANYKVLEGFLSELLYDDITISNILESEGNQEAEDDKYNRVDILVENNRKELTIIEVQIRNEYDYFHRMLYGTSKLISEYLKLKESYNKVKKVYSVNIVYFDIGQGSDYVYHGQTEFKGIHKHDTLILSDKQTELFHKIKPSQIYPEYYIIKVNKFDDYAKSTLDEWIYYLKNDEIKDEFKAKGLAEAKEVLKVDKLPESERRAYKRHLENEHYAASMVETMKIEAEDRIRKEEFEIGVKKGIEERDIEMVLRLHKKKRTISEIADLTGISENKIKQIIENNQTKMT
ncbi:Rpn family recombination-promoting nuclease/putative transposase [Candidatus Poribacteria bacterium]|nr:Rpn family recombination-promoting nuclease/putative transposase [Candidatus Poribacteria bacterium]